MSLDFGQVGRFEWASSHRERRNPFFIGVDASRPRADQAQLTTSQRWDHRLSHRIGFDVAEYLAHEGPSPSLDTDRWMAEWGVAPDFDGSGGLAKPRPEAPARQLWLLQRSPGKPGARLGKTTGWIHRAALKA